MIDEVSSAYRSFQRLLCKLALDKNEGQSEVLWTGVGATVHSGKNAR